MYVSSQKFRATLSLFFFSFFRYICCAVVSRLQQSRCQPWYHDVCRVPCAARSSLSCGKAIKVVAFWFAHEDGDFSIIFTVVVLSHGDSKSMFSFAGKQPTRVSLQRLEASKTLACRYLVTRVYRFVCVRVCSYRLFVNWLTSDLQQFRPIIFIIHTAPVRPVSDLRYVIRSVDLFI
jgi:hypothetical protein